MAGLRIDGFEELQKALKENITLDDVKKVVKHHGGELQERMQRKADFDKGYQTGETKRSIDLEIIENGFAAAVGPQTDYAYYLEYGTRFMDAQPFVRPAFEEQSREFVNDLKKLVR